MKAALMTIYFTQNLNKVSGHKLNINLKKLSSVIVAYQCGFYAMKNI